jgi:hypothetical protein
MDISHTNYQKSTLNNSLGNEPKIDGAIIYSHIKLINVASQPYLSQAERKYKYHQMKDLIFIYILPALVPKVSKKDWAERYFKIKHHISDIPRIEANLDYFQFLLEEAMILINTILYNNNYYMLEDFTDSEYMEMKRMGGVTLGR